MFFLFNISYVDVIEKSKYILVCFFVFEFQVLNLWINNIVIHRLLKVTKAILFRKKLNKTYKSENRNRSDLIK